MALLDFETIGPQLKGIRLNQLEPELLDSVLELAAEHGEVTIASSTNLHFLLSIYRSECAREKKDIERLKKAEDLIMRCAGLVPLHHDEYRSEGQGKGFAGRKALSHLMLDGGMAIGRRERDVFESIGITDEKEMAKAISLLGVEKISERVKMAKSSRLGESLAKHVFGENPSVLCTAKDSDFEMELRAMENKKDLVDKWAKASGMPLPIWADYNESPNVLLVQYTNLYRALVIGHTDGKVASFSAGPENELHVMKMLTEIGLSIEEKNGMLRITCPDGREMWVAPPKEEIIADEGHDRRASSDEKTAPAVPSALERKKKAPGPKLSDTSMLSAIRKMGIDISSLSSELSRISDSSDRVSRSKEHERFEKSVSALHSLLVSDALEETVRKDVGLDSMVITKVAYLSGANGAFELSLSDDGQHVGKRLYLHLQDMGPAMIGKGIIATEGMESHSIWLGRPAEGIEAYALSEDAREVGARKELHIRMPDSFRFERVTGAGAAVFKEDLVLRPDPENEVHISYYSDMSDAEGRRQVFRSLLAYFEMSRRGLLPDRRPSNTFVLLVSRPDGSRAITFQPTDLDGIGNFIDSRDNEPDFSDFNHDFQRAAADFCIQMHEGMVRAHAAGMVKGRVISPSGLFSEMMACAEAFPLDIDEVNAGRDRILIENEGHMIGIGFDASSVVNKTLPSFGGRSEIMRDDGRVALDSGRALKAASIAGDERSQDVFLEGLRPGAQRALSKMPKRIAELAIMMAENPDVSRVQRLRSMSGGEIAYSIFSALPLSNKTALFSIALEEAKRVVMGSAS